ncbi:hypothetical protein CCO03_02740 [Comamonas serinivorans]|uniref:CSD domain-containing protein n=1 Tax=Comamonas serinivorans TaxID=1082851 RepID=A0A1Y0EJJ1_9BURK|nr:cold shock and DUF1294 domain-containing protein [Comamonas serinivorans]ARU03746.1 hypothetical protein CCO03_02740 [Comamonas serinivorans]
MSAAETGTVRSWNDARGFGFVRPDRGGEDVFLHIGALPPGSPRPQVGDRLRYTRTLSRDRKPRASCAELLPGAANGSTTAPRTRAGSSRPPRSGTPRSAGADPARAAARPAGAGPAAGAGRAQASLWHTHRAVLIGFAVVYLASSLLWAVPLWVAGFYLGMSAVAYGVYAADKRAAQTGAWRVAEKHLLWLGLAGGWPGAIVAQQRLRHKSSKAEFRTLFWVTVVLNVAGFLVAVSPWGRAALNLL